MKTIVAGSRGVTSSALVDEAIRLSGFTITEVVSGTAAGVDQLGEDFAWAFDIPVKLFPADWKKHKKAAGFIRNEEMAKYAEAAVIIWDGSSKGTANMIKLATKYNLKTKIFLVKDNKLLPFEL